MQTLSPATLFQALQQTVAKYGGRAAYAMPPMPARAYYPQGCEFTWNETFAAVQERIHYYRASGYGPGHRVAILFEQRPEFVFHHFALNALGCCTVPVSPDYRHNELVYLLEHSECSVVLGIAERLDDLRAAARELAEPIPVQLFAEAPSKSSRSPAPPWPRCCERRESASPARIAHGLGLAANARRARR